MEEKTEEQKREEFVKEYEALCKKFGLTIAGNARLEQLEGHVFRNVPFLEIVALPKSMQSGVQNAAP